MSGSEASQARPVTEIEAGSIADNAQFTSAVIQACRPVVIRDLVAAWPIVQAACVSRTAFHRYLSERAQAAPVEAFVGDRDDKGRYYYGDGLKGFNFDRRPTNFAAAVEAIFAGSDEAAAHSVYVGSVPTEGYLRDFASENALPMLPPSASPRIWLGHASNISCHFDTLDNVACVVAGRRRFTLYPPDAIGDLYVGPIDNTMAGQPVSLAAAAGEGHVSDYPRFALARDRRQFAELGPGDAIYIPKLWWHQVEGLAPINGLVNYWWDATATGADPPYAALLMALISIAERPLQERSAWHAFFEHYVFREERHPLEHLPGEQHGILGPLRPDNYGRLRTIAMHMLRGR